MAKTKKKVKNIKRNDYSSDTEVTKLIKLIVIVSLIVLVFYGITILVNQKEEVETQKTPASVQYDEILIGNMLNQPNDEYYVMIYDNEDYDANLYSVYLTLYSQKKDAIRVYTSQLNNPLNQKFKSDKANLDVGDLTDLKISGSTLFKINNKKIKAVYEGEELEDYLAEISKTEETE